MKKWFIIGSKRTGYQHENRSNKIPCQDSFSIRSRGSSFAASLGDGLGSSKHSEEGSDVATKTATKLLLAKSQDYINLENPETLIIDVVDGIVEKLNNLADAKDYKIDDLATTLMFTLVDNDNFIIGHLGDGAVASVMNNGDTEVISTEPKNDDKTTTVSITQNKAYSSFRVFKGKIKDRMGFVMMSDGSEHLFVANLVDGKKALVHDAYELFESFSKDPSEFQNLINKHIEEKIYPHSHDDISMVFMLAKEIDSFFKQLNEDEKNSLIRDYESSEDIGNINDFTRVILNAIELIKWPTTEDNFRKDFKKSNSEINFDKFFDFLKKTGIIIINEDNLIEVSDIRVNT